MPRLRSKEPFLQQSSEQSSLKRKKIEFPQCTHPNVLCSPKEGVSRKFLLCADKNKLVPVDQLLNKHLGLFFVKLSNSDHLPYLQPLICVYDELCKKFPACFEIVFVALFRDHQHPNPLHRQQLFDLHLSRMPWPALPFDDNSKWSEHIEFRHGGSSLMYNYISLMLFDPSGHCLNMNALETLLRFGHDFYPFTDARITEMSAQYHALMQPWSLETLLASASKVGGSSRRNFLITLADGAEHYRRVPITQLHGSVLGLFFFHGVRTSKEEDRNRVFLEKLHTCRAHSKGSFEVVFINIEYDQGFQSEESFHDFMRKWPWLLALPFKDDIIRALSFVFDVGVGVNCANFNRLVIVGGDGDKFQVDPHGYRIVKKYGFEAYPFTRDKVIELEKKRLRRLKLADVFGATSTEFLFRVGRKKKQHVSFLQGKRVLLYIGYRLDISKVQALQEKEKSLSVVLVANRTDGRGALPVLPKNWLVYSPPMRGHMEDRLFEKLKVYLCGDFMVFDESGDFLTMGFLSVIRIDFPNDFPFVSDETFDEEFRDTVLRANDEWILEVHTE